jgi:hypothetical protein
MRKLPVSLEKEYRELQKLRERVRRAEAAAKRRRRRAAADTLT